MGAGLDTTTRDGSVALIRNDDVVVERPGDPAWTHAERLPADLRAVLAEAGLALSEVDLVAVATGPGAFTGLRIGLAAAQGLALALDRPAAGVPTLGALAWGRSRTAPGQPAP
ncbi:MAG: tRNA (adenosine(37)-N6)-threonylcarbamoyltransferase complex dimerization subunit type 1 TsaB [Vicinamibacterales bacterium]